MVITLTQSVFRVLEYVAQMEQMIEMYGFQYGFQNKPFVEKEMMWLRNVTSLE